MTSRAGNAKPHPNPSPGEREEGTSPLNSSPKRRGNFLPSPLGEGLGVRLVHIVMQKLIVTQQVVVIIQIVFGNKPLR